MSTTSVRQPISKTVLVGSFVALTLFLVGCGSSPNTQPQPPSGNSVPSVPSDQYNTTSSAVSSASGITVVPQDSGTSPSQVIAMTVDNFVFTPDVIRAKKGEKVTIQLTDIAGVHSFVASDLGIDVAVQPGETKTFEIPTAQVGTFEFHCGIPCGEGHRDMVGQIIVE